MSSPSSSRILSEENPIPRPKTRRTSVRDRRVALGDISNQKTGSRNSSSSSTLVHCSKKAPKLSRNWNLGILDCVLPNAESNVIVPDEDTELPQIDDNLLASSPASPTQSEMVVRRAVRSKRLVFDPEIQDMVSRQANSVDVKRMKRMFENAVEENIRNTEAYVTGLKELIAKLQYQKHLLVYQVLELEENEKCLRRRLLQEDMDDGLEFHIQLGSLSMNHKRKGSSLRRLFSLVFFLAMIFLIGNAFITVDYKEGIAGWSSIIRLNLAKLKMCKTQLRPPGSETLPRGIVASTSDLEMRPLWGAKRNKKPKPYLLAMAAGIKQKESVNKIVKKFPSSEFVVMLFHYDGAVDEWKEFEWSETAIHISVVNQTKWWFAKRFLHPDIVSAYSYIFLWDEDLGVDHFDARRYVSTIKEEGLEISQPALDPNLSEVHHQLTSRDNKSRVHRRTYKVIGRARCNENSTGPPCTGFVEMMAPVFSRAAWRCTWHMIQSDLNHGWGIDFQLGYCAQEVQLKIRFGTGCLAISFILAFMVFIEEVIVVTAYKQTDSGQLDKTKTQHDSDISKPSSTSSGRSEVRKQTYAELETFKHRWKNAVKNDECWIDRFQP